MLALLATNLAEMNQQAIMQPNDWKEIIFLVIGAAIGLIASLVTTVFQRQLDKIGKLNIFYKFISPKSASRAGWGFRDSHEGYMYFSIPVVYELQNTSNTTRVIRDVSLLLYRGDHFVDRMTQINYMTSKSRANGTIVQESEYHYGSEKGSYSFVLAPRSIQRQECHYSFKCPITEKDDRAFDQIVVRYYDENNTAHYLIAKDISGNWDEHIFAPDTEWFLLQKKKKVRKNKR